MTEDEIHKIAAVESSHWWYVGTREICFSLLAPCIAGRGPLRILDIGCGTGGNLVELGAFGEARGIDVNPLCVDYCTRRGLHVSLGSMQQLHAAAASLDLVTLFDVLTQAERAEAPGTLVRIAEALAPGGLLAFREPAMPVAGGAHDRAVNVHHRFTRPEVAGLLAEAGLTPLRLTYLNTLLFPPIVLMRRVQNALFPSRAESDVEPAGWPLNDALLGVLRLETRLLRATDLPFGVSLFAIAKKGSDGGQRAPATASRIAPTAGAALDVVRNASRLRPAISRRTRDV